MKILVVSNMYPDEKHPFYGTFVKTFCNQLKMINQDFDLSVMYKKDSKIHKLINYFTFYFNTVFKILTGKYECVYVHYASHSSLPVLFAYKLKKFKIYTNVHGSDVIPENEKQLKMQKYTKEILKISSEIIVPSEYFKQIVLNKYDISDSKIVKVYPSGGIDETIFTIKKESDIEMFKTKYNLDLTLPTYGMAGRISTDKGWDVFVNAISLAIEKGLDANYVLVGSGDEESQLNSLIKEKGLVDVIKRIPLLPQEELSKFYSSLDYFVFPTKREGESLGLVAIEAMACGTPVLSSDFAAPKYYVINNYNGYKFEVGNAVELSNLMINTANKSNINELKNNAIKTATEYYSKNVIQELKNIFR